MMIFEKSLEWYLKARGMRQELLFQSPARFHFTLGGIMMIAKAVSKLKTEIESKKDNPYIQVIGGFLLDHLDRNPQDADKIMTDGKTIAKSLDEMRKAASKKKVDNCAVLTDQEGFAIVLKYFGIEHNGAVIVPASAPVMPVPKASSDFDIKLDDLL